MAYFDYAGYAWRRQCPGGAWERYRDAEGALVAVDGRRPSLYHCALGKLDGVLVLGYKQAASIRWRGQKIAIYPNDAAILTGTPEESAAAKEEIGGEQEGFRWALKYIEYPHSNGCMMFLHDRRDDIATAGIVGYGIGDHSWLDSEGYEWFTPGDRWNFVRRRSEIIEHMMPEDVLAITEEEVARLAADGWQLHELYNSDAAERDIKRLGLSGRDAYDYKIKRKPKKPWPREHELAQRVQVWAEEILYREQKQER